MSYTDETAKQNKISREYGVLPVWALSQNRAKTENLKLNKYDAANDM